MRAFDSSIGRLAVAVVTAAIGLEAMRSQSEFWLGVLAALAALWVTYAVATAIAERGRRRASCLAFAAATSACLAAFFGPWSDVAFRGNLSDTASIRRVESFGLPTTRFLLRFCNRYVHPQQRGTIVMLDPSGRPSIELVVVDLGSRPGDLEVMTDDLETSLRVTMGYYGGMRPGFPVRAVVSFRMLDIYLHAAYLLLSLTIGALASGVVLLFRRIPPRSHESS